MKKILITGGAGYIGSKLCTKLISEGFQVTVVDRMQFSKNSLDHLIYNKNFKLFKEDVRNKKLMKNLILKNDFIIPLAALVGAPLCQKNKKLAKEINYECIKYIIENINNKKIIYLNTNSGYGIGEKGKFCDEESPLNPISLYGKTKCDAEKEVIKSKNFVCFRLATVFGYSYRMRTDLLINDFTYKLLKQKKLTLFESHFRRNFININDVVGAIIYSINNFHRFKNNIFNLGLSEANYTKLQLAKKIKKLLNNKSIIKVANNKKDPDKRDYFVSNKKLERYGFIPTYTVEEGVNELKEVYKNLGKIKNNYET
jgi:nucleoside-diphosphate-sugar epimerase